MRKERYRQRTFSAGKSGSSHSATAVRFNCGKPGHFQKDCRQPKKGKGKSKGGKKGLNSVERKEDEPEAETSYLEISMTEDTAMDTSAEEGEVPAPHVGVPKCACDLAKRRYRRMLQEGRPTIEWRRIPISRYRQRVSAMAKAQLAYPGSVVRAIAKKEDLGKGRS